MVFVKEIAAGLGALGCAVAIGFVMQNTEAGHQRYGNGAVQERDASPQRIDSIEDANAANAMLDVQQITLTSAEFESGISLPQSDSAITQVAAPALPETPDVPPLEVAPVPPVPACEITAEARAKSAAMVALSLEASCLPNERVTVHHNGMIFTEVTDAQGALDLSVPALAREAVFILAFSNGEGTVAQVTVEDMEDFQRAVLQWKGDTGFQIHAREFGAGYGEKGHLWEGAPGTITDAVLGESGVLTRHGNVDAAEPLIAEVYTYPGQTSLQTGEITLTVEAEVTKANCGIEIEAQSLEVQRDGVVKTRNLTLPVPDCDAAGSFLVLNNLLQDLKVAAR